MKTIYLNDLVLNLSSMFAALGSNIFQLSNENYLYVSALGLQTGRDRRTRQLYSLEIDSKTLEAVKVGIKPVDNILKYGDALQIEFINDLLVFKAYMRMPGNDPDNGYTSLILASSDFKILDFCPVAKLRRNFSLLGVSNSRVISQGDPNLLYLHEVDFERKKLVLLKTVFLDDVKILHHPLTLLESIGFFCVAKPALAPDGVNEAKTLLRFNMELELVSHFKFTGMKYMTSIYALGNNKALFFESLLDLPNRGNRGSLFVLDLKTGGLQLANIVKRAWKMPDLVKDSETGRVFNLHMDGDKIIKVYLN